jgi:hypothetical protein
MSTRVKNLLGEKNYPGYTIRADLIIDAIRRRIEKIEKSENID